MIIRPHPQNVKGWMADESWITRLNLLINDRIKLFMPKLVDSKLLWSMDREDMIKLSTVLSSCVVCINSCSTLSIDTLMAGKGNIAPLFDGETNLPYWASVKRLMDYAHIKKFIQFGGTQVVFDYPSLIEEINYFIADPDYKIQNRTSAREMECGKEIHRSTENVINALLTICTEPK